MKITEFKELCFSSKNGIYARESYIKKHFPEIYNDILQKDYPIVFSFQQKLYHYLENDDFLKIGICPVCGKRTIFLGLRVGYTTFCSNTCSYKSSERNNKISKAQFKKTNKEKKEIQKKKEKTKLERYGDENYNNYKQICETKKVLYGNSKYNNKNKIKDTLLSRTTKEIESSLQKGKETKKRLYGNENYVNKEQIKNTWKLKPKEEIDERTIKTKSTKLERYGDENYVNVDKLKETRRKTEIDKNPLIVGYTDDGRLILKCNNKDCCLCEEKTYITPRAIYNDRIRFGYVSCTKANPINKPISGCEGELKEYIHAVYNGTLIENDRKILNGVELDIFIPDKNIAFEYNGVYWHSELFKDVNYHQEKSLMCLEKGVQLVHIWEDDWIGKKEIVKNLVAGKLGLHTNKINARECFAKEINSKVAKDFCDTYHIQGYTVSSVKLGLFYNNKLVMVCLFGKKRRLSGGKPKDNEWELYRMCSVFNTHVNGGASKLFKYFVEKYSPSVVVTYADVCVSNGNVYEKWGLQKNIFPHQVIGGLLITNVVQDILFKSKIWLNAKTIQI